MCLCAVDPLTCFTSVHIRCFFLPAMFKLLYVLKSLESQCNLFHKTYLDTVFEKSAGRGTLIANITVVRGGAI